MKADDSWMVALRATPLSTGAAHPASDGSSGGVVPLVVVALAVLIAVLTQLVPSRRRRLAGARVAGLSGDRVHSFGRRDAVRGSGDRVRVAFDQMGSEVLIVTVAVASAVALGALIAG